MAKRKKRQKSTEEGPRVYSYIRFSSAAQASGDSLRRQTEKAEAWCKERGLTLDKSLRMADLGVSAFHGDNAEIGELAAFYEEVRKGNVPPGSILLVESLDRLSRTRITDALEGFLKLIKKGIAIATLSDNRIFHSKADSTDMMMALMVMSRAYEESATKSMRRAATWEKDRRRMAEGIAVTSICPEWLRVVDNRFEIIKERAKAIRRLFELRAEGYGGAERIAQKLNDEADWLPAGRSTRRSKDAKPPGWRKSYVSKILSNQAVIGLYQPKKREYDEVARKKRSVEVGEPIKYYPQIVEPELFYSVQSEAVRGTPSGRTGRFWNVLRGITRCGYCGGPMHFENKGPSPKGGRFLYCDDAKRGVAKDCTSTRIRYDLLAERILDVCGKIGLDEVLPSKSDRTKAISAAKRRLRSCEARVEELAKKLDNITDLFEDCEEEEREEKQRLRERLDARREELSLARSEQKEASKALDQAELDGKDFSRWQAELGDLKSQLLAPDAVDTRRRLNSLLREHIERIDVMPIGYGKPLHFVQTTPERKPSTVSKSGRRRASNRVLPEQVEDDIEDRLVAVLDETGGALSEPLLRAGGNEATPPDPQSPTAWDFVQWAVQKRAGRDGAFARIRFISGRTVDVPVGQYASGKLLTLAKGRKKPEIVNREPGFNDLKRAFEASRKR